MEEEDGHMNESLPRITIVTPSLNQGRFIEQTILSVLNQGYPDLEYLVMDGGSTDDTHGILQKFENQLRWFNEKDTGQSQAINKGLRMAKGEIVGFLNTDDLLLPGALWTVGKYFSRNPHSAWVTGRCRIIDPHGYEIRKWISRYKDFWLSTRSYAVLSVINYISQPATFWRRELLEEIGYMDEHLVYSMDYDYWLRIGRKYRLSILWDNLALFRIHPSSKAGSSAGATLEAEIQIARQHVGSPILMTMHRLHSAVILSVYRKLFKTPQ